MPLREYATTALTKPTTRRTVVRTGAKLAYTVPLVAGSFKLATRQALALSPIAECAGGDCELNIQFCNEDFTCICFTSVEGNGYCHTGQVCGGSQTCTSTDDCQEGFFCSDQSCCGTDFGKICLQGCLGVAAAAAPGVRWSTPQ